MKKFIHFTAAIIVMVLGVSLFTGCDPTPAEDKNRKMIKVSILNSPSEKDALSAWRSAFYEAQPDIGIKVEYLQGGTRYATSIITDYAGDILADVIWTAGDYHSTLSDAGVFMSLKEFIDNEEDDYLDDFYPAILESARLAGEEKNDIRFMPRDYNKIVVVYNKDMFDAAGVAYPTDDWTWDDMVAKLRIFRDKMDANADPEYGLYKNSCPLDGKLSWEPFAYSMLRGFGGDIYKDGNYENAFTQEGDHSGTDAFFEEIRMFGDERLSGIDSQGGGGLFISQSAAMGFYVRPNIVAMQNQGINFDFAPFPKMSGEDIIGTGCSGYAISSKSENKNEAWEFIKFIASKEGQEVFARTGAGIPVRKSLAQSDTWTNWKAGYMDYTPKNAVFTMYPEKDISVNYFDKLPVKMHTGAITRFKESVQIASEWTPSKGFGGGGKDYATWFVEYETKIKTTLSVI